MGLEEIKRLKEQAKLPKVKKVYKIPKKSTKKIRQEAEEKALIKNAVKLGLGACEMISASIQEQWFKDRMAESLPICMNCGMDAQWLLLPEYEKIWRACQAHVLPKRKSQFPSVATHPMNHMVLFPVWGGHLCGCHDEYDSGWYNATTMKVWEIAVSRFKEFEACIAPKERRHIPDALMQYVKNETDI